MVLILTSPTHSNYHPTAITSLSANSGSFEGSDTDKVFFSKIWNWP